MPTLRRRDGSRPCLRIRLARLSLGLGLGLAALAGPGATASAQSTGTLVVTVRRPDSTPLPWAFVRSERLAAVADDSGHARIELPARLVAVLVSHPGYQARGFEITILPGVVQRYELILPVRVPADDSTVIAATRAGRLKALEPVAVVTVDRRRLEAGALAHPADLARLWSGIAGIRTQLESGPLDAGRFRANGIRGQYTGLLIDGMPLLGGPPGAFGAMQLSPFEFEQVEWVKGPASALYGPSAPGGVINFLPRRPDRDRVAIHINQSSEKGGDLAFFAAGRRSPTLSATVAADFHQQRLVDADDDNWGEFPRTIRFAIRPRVFVEAPTGDGLTATVGAMSEDRTGGFLLASTGDDVYREERRTRRVDGAVTGRRGIGPGTLRVKLAGVTQSISHAFDQVRERDRRTTLFLEASFDRPIGKAAVVLGVAYQRDALRQRDLPAFDYTHSYPSAFGSVTVALDPRVTASLAGRCDRHNVHGEQCNSRVDLLFRPTSEVAARFFAGVGYTAPVPLADEAEVLGFGATIPIAAKAERLLGGGADLSWRKGPFGLGAALALTRIRLPVRLVPAANDTANRLRLLNLDEPTRVAALDFTGSYQDGPWTASGFLEVRKATEGIPGSATRRDADLTPRYRLGLNVGWQSPVAQGTTVDAELIYFGRQAVTDSPFRTESLPYGIVNGIVTQRSGRRARLYLNAENLLDVRLRDHDPVVLPGPTFGGRRTNMPWIPLRGRVISLGALVEW